MKVVKIGGSVAGYIREILEELLESAKRSGDVIVIIPGGWIFSDIVRFLDSNLAIKKANAMAILGMEMYALYISSFGCKTLEFNFDDFTLDFDKLNSDVFVLKPYSIIELIERELPENWDVTSDSIAIWFANKIGVKKTLKVTDVDGLFINNRLVRYIKAYRLFRLEKSCIDRYAPKLLLKYGMKMSVCNGKIRGRVKKYIVEGKTVGTLIDGEI